MPAIGIDLGTTFSAVATFRNGVPEILLNADGERITPSVLYWEGPGPDHWIVGQEAKGMLGLGDERATSLFKRSMGDESFFFMAGEARLSATELSSILLRELKSGAEAALGCEVRDAVVTVPAYFDDQERAATIEAARLAGLNVLKIINEPTAAAIAYGLDNLTEGNRVLVYDLGGGTFDVTVISIVNGGVKVLGTDGDHRLGGKDWDDAFASVVRYKFMDEFGEDPFADHTTYLDMLARAEAGKKELSKKNAATVRVTSQGGNTGTYTVSREEFEEATAGLMAQTKTLCEKVISQCNEPVTWADIDGVLLVGGSTRMPMVAEMARTLSGKAPLEGINVDEAVALGAAICAAGILREDDDFSLTGKVAESDSFALTPTVTDVVSHSLGMVAVNEDFSRYVNSVIIPKNSPIPGAMQRPYTLRLGGENPELDVYLLQGESERPLDCTMLGRYVFSGLAREKAKEAIIDVSYDHDDNGMVIVSAKQRTTGRFLDLRKEPVPEDMSWLDESPEAVAKRNMKKLGVALVVDTSGSMYPNSILEAEKAALNFIDKLDMERFAVSVLAFGDKTKVVSPLTADIRQVRAAVKELHGTPLRGTNGLPIEPACRTLDGHDGDKFIILLTDGEWFRPREAIAEAKECKKQNIGIVAIGIGQADIKFLRQLATHEENAMFTELSNLGNSFSSIAQVLVESDAKGMAMFQGMTTGGGRGREAPVPARGGFMRFFAKKGN